MEKSNNDIVAVLKGIKIFTGKKPEEFPDWLKKFSLLLSFRRRDLYDIIEGAQRPASDTTTITLEQAAFDQANEDLYAILFLVTEKPAALLVAKHADDSRGTRGDGQAAMNELEAKYLSITNESIRATQRALTEIQMEVGQDPDEYINEATLLRDRLHEMKEPITDRHFMDIILQGLTDQYKDVKLMIWKDPDIKFDKIQSVLRHVYQDEQSRNRIGGVYGRGAAGAIAMTAAAAKTVICHNCGVAGHYERGCAMPSKRKPKSKEQGKKWCSIHNTTSHSDEECYNQGAEKPAKGAAMTATTTGAEEKPVIDFRIEDDEDFAGGFMF